MEHGYHYEIEMKRFVVLVEVGDGYYYSFNIRLGDD